MHGGGHHHGHGHDHGGHSHGGHGGHGHHDHTAGASARMLGWALALTTAYLVVEVAGAFLFNSLALLSDAAHMLTDAAALAIALMAIRIGQKPADDKRTFGYRRFEILAAAFNALLLFAVAGYVLVEAIRRVRAPEHVESGGMLIIAVIGLIVNLIAMRLLMAGKDESLNVKGAYLEVWSDMIGSAGVILGALVIRFTGWLWVDTVIAVGIALWVLPRTWTLLRATTNVLLEGVPGGLDIGEIRGAVAAAPGVAEMHDLHIWSMTNEDVSATMHVVLEEDAAPDRVRQGIAALLRDRWHIGHVTIQTEGPGDPCPDGPNRHL